MSRKKQEPEKAAAGGAGWVMTFADLMSLLMAFFVMLLAMAEVDKEKFKEMGISMKVALGSPVNTPAHSADDIKLIKDTSKTGNSSQKMQQDATLERMKKTLADAEKLKEVLKDQIDEMKIEVESHGEIIVIRMLESGVFKSGKSELVDDFHPVLANLRRTLKDMRGEIVVSGHADDIPIENGEFRSNWELSAARAYSVIDDMLEENDIPSDRFVLRGFGSSRPLVPNINAENRAKNRRVEIMVDQRGADVEPVKTKEAEGPVDLSGVNLDDAIAQAPSVGGSELAQTGKALPGVVPMSPVISQG